MATDIAAKPTVPFDRSEHGARVVVKWPKIVNGGEGEPYEVREPGASLVTFSGTFDRSVTVHLLGSNDGESYHLLIGRSTPGAVTLHAMPLYVKPAVWGGEDTEVGVAISLNDGI